MTRYAGMMMWVALLAGCADLPGSQGGGEPMKVLTIRWQRLVDEKGRTCERCGATGTAVEAAVAQLKRSLKELGIDVVLEKGVVDFQEFSTDPLASNRLWVGGRPIEDWLEGTVGHSKCCSVCGDSDCRTLTVNGQAYEEIPAELIVRAGLLAAAQLVSGTSRGSCCPPAKPAPKGPGCCPPESPPKQR